MSGVIVHVFQTFSRYSWYGNDEEVCAPSTLRHVQSGLEGGESCWRQIRGFSGMIGSMLRLPGYCEGDAQGAVGRAIERRAKSKTGLSAASFSPNG